MKTRTWIVVALLVGVSACSKPNEPKTGASNEADEPVFRSSIDAANPKNPFDSTGIYHNLLLDSAQQLLEQNGSVDIRRVCTYMASVFTKYHDVDLAKFKKIGTNLFNDLAKNQADSLAGFIGSGEAQEYVRALFQIIAIKKKDSYSTIRDNILTLEAKIMSSALSKTEREILLRTSSVARHSAARWMSVRKGALDLLFLPMIKDPERVGVVINADTKAYLKAKREGHPEPICALFSSMASLLDALSDLWPF